MTSLTFRSQALLLGLAPVLLATALLGTVAYRSAHAALEGDAVRTVGLAATARQEALLERLGRQDQRARSFLLSLRHCPVSIEAVRAACVKELLTDFVATEQAQAARVTLAGLPEPVVAGTELANWPQSAPLPAGQLARIEPATAGKRYYDLAVGKPEALIEVRFEAESLNRIFLQRAGLGETGETFLADKSGLFVTAPRHPGHSGEVTSHPIDARPMVACLSGKSAELLAADYRNEDVIHGFRFIPQVGGGCIMAHIEQREAFRPAEALRRQFALMAAGCALLAALLALIFARQLAAPIARLSERAEALEAGRPLADLPADGPREVQSLAATFARMARSVRQSLDERGAALERETQARKTAELLADEVREQGREVEQALLAMRAEKERAEERLAALSRPGQG